MKMINKNNEDLEENKELEELIVYKNLEEKDLDIRIEKKGYKFEKKGRLFFFLKLIQKFINFLINKSLINT